MVNIDPAPNPADYPGLVGWHEAAAEWYAKAQAIIETANTAEGESTPDLEGEPCADPDAWYQRACAHREFSLHYFNDLTPDQRREIDREKGWSRPLSITNERQPDAKA